MASRQHRQLVELGFSERFLRTSAGNHPAIRGAILGNPALWQPCRNCGDLFVLTTRLPRRCENKHGDDMRGRATPPQRNGFCSSHCATETLGDDGAGGYRHVRAMDMARRKDFYRTEEWRRLRYQALARNGNRCQCCGRSPSDGAIMHVDHIKPKYWRPELALSIDNLQVLCEQCNLGKGMHDDTDWREVS